MMFYFIKRCFREQDRRIEILEKENIALAKRVAELQRDLDKSQKDQEKVNNMILQMLVKNNG